MAHNDTDNGSEQIAIAALSWIASDGTMMNRFMSITGIEADQIRLAAREPGFLAGVLSFLMAHEPTLLSFCQDNEITPQDVSRSYQRLSGGAVPGPGEYSA